MRARLYLYSVINRNNQIVCFEHTLNILGDTSLLLIQAVSLCLDQTAGRILGTFLCLLQQQEYDLVAWEI